MRGEVGIAFSMPGGNASGTAGSRPVDMAHLARQTMDDRALEQEVLGLFVQQALSVRDKILDADAKARSSRVIRHASHHLPKDFRDAGKCWRRHHAGHNGSTFSAESKT